MQRYIILGGSAGSFQSVVNILEALPKDFPHTFILILHRLKHVREGFVEALNIKTKVAISEPRDKEKIKPNHIYLAPANYHLYIEPDNTFALSTEEPVNHSRPSIDISFVSAAYVLKKKLTGIILSGANKDGAQGLKQIAEQKGNVLIQSIKEAQVQTMPQYAKDLVPMAKEYTISEIIEYILNC